MVAITGGAVGMLEGKQPPRSAVVDAGVQMHQIRWCRSSPRLHRGPRWRRRDPVKTRQIPVYFSSLAVWAREEGEGCPTAQRWRRPASMATRRPAASAMACAARSEFRQEYQAQHPDNKSKAGVPAYVLFVPVGQL